MNLRAFVDLEAEGRIETILTALGDASPAALSPDAALLAGRCLLRRPDPAAALPFLRRAVEPGSPDATAIEGLRALARLHVGLGQEVIAIGHLRTLLKRRPMEREPRFALVEALYRLGWHAAAIREGDALARPIPGWWRRIETAARQGRAAARRQALRVLGRRDGTGRVPLPRGARLVQLIRWLLAAGRIRAAAGLARRGVAQPGSGPRIRMAELEVQLYVDGVVPGVSLRLPPTGADAEVLVEAARLALQIDLPELALEALARLPILDESATPLRVRALIRLGRHATLAPLAAAERDSAPRSIVAARHAMTGWVLAGMLPVRRSEGPPAAVAATPLLQFWHAPTPPDDVAAVIASWTNHHSFLQPARFDAASARAWLAAEAGSSMAALFDFCRHPAMQADLFRLVFLERHGGLYVDVDERCLRPVPELIGLGRTLGLAAPYINELPYYLNNNLLLAAPGSPVMARALATVSEALEEARGGRPPIWNTTGPGALTRAVVAHLAAGDGAPVLLLCPRYVASFSRTEGALAYKQEPGGDWRWA